MKFRIRTAALAATLLSCAYGSAYAADPVDWTGFYVGGNVGAFSGNAHVTDPNGATLYGDDVTTPGFGFGVQGGYNYQLNSRWVVGFEGSADYLATQGNNTCLQSSGEIIGSNCKAQPQEIATFTGRLGYLTEPNGGTMLFGRGGAAWMHGLYAANPNHTFQGYTGPVFGDQPEQGSPSSISASTWGWTIGAGIEHRLRSGWSATLSYDYLRFGNLSLTTPQTMNADVNDNFFVVPGGAAAGIVQEVHLVRLGLNYQFGARQPAASAPADAAPEPAAPLGWQIDVGSRFWYSWGKYQGTNGPQPELAISRLTYDNMQGKTGEIFARIDAPFNVFIKGMIGAGGINTGTMVDEDWGQPGSGPPDTYSNTTSRVTGTLTYFTADIGYSFLRTPTYKFGGFIGYNRYQTSMDAFGCYQNVPTSGVCATAFPDSTNGVSQFDTWNSFRTGVAAEARITDRFTIGGEVAFLPYVLLDGLDMHKQRDINFPVTGSGQGVQTELVLSYRMTEALSIGVGGRYWAMWTNNAEQSDNPGNYFTINTERYGIFAQLSYRFETPH
jgi:opacity protein-like surface antigen/outer membrane protease